MSNKVGIYQVIHHIGRLGLDANHQLVLLSLITHQGDDRSTYVSPKKIAYELGCSFRQQEKSVVSKRIQELARLGFVISSSELLYNKDGSTRTRKSHDISPTFAKVQVLIDADKVKTVYTLTPELAKTTDDPDILDACYRSNDISILEALMESATCDESKMSMIENKLQNLEVRHGN